MLCDPRTAVTASGTSRLTSAGTNTAFMRGRVVTCPPIHSMVVVTSPMGDQAPPELAAITITPAKNRRSRRSASSFCISETITMVVVRLSRIALRKNVQMPTIQSSEDTDRVRIREVMTSKPSCASTTSTMVIAPSRKKMICAVPSRDSPRSAETT